MVTPKVNRRHHLLHSVPSPTPANDYGQGSIAHEYRHLTLREIRHRDIEAAFGIQRTASDLEDLDGTVNVVEEPIGPNCMICDENFQDFTTLGHGKTLPHRTVVGRGSDCHVELRRRVEVRSLENRANPQPG